jgi:xeroderma pigmentosum group C-complementing protein
MRSGDDSSLVAADSDEDIDWEEIDVSQPTEQPNIEITLQAQPKQKQDKSDKSVLLGMFHSLVLI